MCFLCNQSVNSCVPLYLQDDLRVNPDFESVPKIRIFVTVFRIVTIEAMLYTRKIIILLDLFETNSKSLKRFHGVY